MLADLRASVIVRSRDRERTIGRALTALRKQTVEPEIIVVDSGSTDRTVEIASRYADRVVHVSPEAFTYGYALNVGAAAASGRVHFALSAHCVPTRSDWIELALRHYAQPRVAATNGAAASPSRGGLDGPLLAGYAEQLRDPYWGFSNHASSWRADVWREFPFDPELIASEDREWALRVSRAGWLIAFDPALLVDAGHREREGVRALYRRARRESFVIATVTRRRSYGRRGAMNRWWADLPPDERTARRLRQRVNPHRLAEIAGRHVGERQALRTQRPGASSGN